MWCTFFWVLNSLLYQVDAQGDALADDFRPQAQIRCIGNIPADRFWLKVVGLRRLDAPFDGPPSDYNTVREICAKRIYGGSATGWNAGGYCAFEANPKTVVFEKPDLGRFTTVLERHVMLFCQTRCRCVSGTLQELVEQGRPAVEIRQAELEIAPRGSPADAMNLRLSTMDFNPRRAYIGQATNFRLRNLHDYHDAVPEFIYFMTESDSPFFDTLVQNVNMSVVLVAIPGVNLVCNTRPVNKDYPVRLSGLLPRHLQQALDEDAARVPNLYDQMLRISPAAICATRWAGGSFSANAGFYCDATHTAGDYKKAFHMYQSPVSSHPTLMKPDDPAAFDWVKAFCLDNCVCPGHSLRTYEKIYDTHIDNIEREYFVDVVRNSAVKLAKPPPFRDDEPASNSGKRQRLITYGQTNTCPTRAACQNWADCTGLRLQSGCDQAICVATERQRLGWQGQCMSLTIPMNRARLGGRGLEAETESGDDVIEQAGSFDTTCLCNSTYTDKSCCLAEDGLIWK